MLLLAKRSMTQALPRVWATLATAAKCAVGIWLSSAAAYVSVANAEQNFGVPRQEAPSAIAISTDGTIGASGYRTGEIVLLDLETGKETAVLRSATAVARLSFSPRGSFLVSLHRKRTVQAKRGVAEIKLWDVAHDRRLWSRNKSFVHDVFLASEEELVIVTRQTVEFRRRDDPSVVLRSVQIPKEYQPSDTVRPIMDATLSKLFIPIRTSEYHWHIMRVAAGSAKQQAYTSKVGPSLSRRGLRALACAARAGIIAVAADDDVFLLDCETLKPVAHLTLGGLADSADIYFPGATSHIFFSNNDRHVVALRRYSGTDNPTFTCVAWDWPSRRQLWVEQLPQRPEPWDQFCSSRVAGVTFVGGVTGELWQIKDEDIHLRPPRSVTEYMILEGIEIDSDAPRATCVSMRGNGNTEATDERLAWLRFCPNVTELVARESKKGDPLTDVGLSHIARLTKLESLELETGIENSCALISIARSCPLKSLDLSAPRLREIAAIQDMALLRKLRLRVPSLPADRFAPLAQCRKLKELHLRGNRQVDDRTLKDIARIPSIKFLGLGNTSVTDSGVAIVAGMKQLKGISFWGTEISDASLPQLAKMTSLRELCLIETRVTETAVIKLRKRLPECKISWGRL